MEIDSKEIEESNSSAEAAASNSNVPPSARMEKLSLHEETKDSGSVEGPRSAPLCIIVLGMAGSGKTTFIKKLVQLAYEKTRPYVVNLDPACAETPYFCNIDIRDTVNYKEVMQQYKLGPNGGIVTSLNLFATQFEKVTDLIGESTKRGYKWCVLDTPGQIEVFTWSASGTIITEALATMFPTLIVYVMDVARSTSPTTFMSNMLYACSILYKTRLPFIVVLNKVLKERCSSSTFHFGYSWNYGKKKRLESSLKCNDSSIF